MAYQTDWLIDQRIVRVVMDGSVDIDEVKRMQDDMFAYFDDGIAPVHLIIDIANVTSYPSVFSLTKLTGSRRHPSVGWTLVVGTNSVTQFIASTILNLVGVSFRMFSTFEAAQEFLRKQDATVPM